MINGVINIYKDKGYSSFHAVAALRHFTGEKKIGHTGTLDPDATGVLPICIGRATKLVGQLTDTDKRYRAVMLLGRRTDTQDISGHTLEEMSAEEVIRILDIDKIPEAFNQYTGDILQIPPMYSAVKVGGVKLVDAARKGRDIERKPRPVRVIGFSDINIDTGSLEISFTVDCSKGTYVRTLCEDIGRSLGIPACLKSLERTMAAGLDISDSISLDKACKEAENGTLERYIIPTDHFLLSYDYLIAGDDAVRKLIYGNYLTESDLGCVSDPVMIAGKEGAHENAVTYRIYDTKGDFYALYRYDPSDRYYKCVKMFR